MVNTRSSSTADGSLSDTDATVAPKVEMFAPVQGNMEPFEEQRDTFQSWLRRFTQLMLINNVKQPERKLAYLISVIGRDAYHRLEGLVAPDDPADKSFDEIVAILNSHYTPKPLIIAERFRFYNHQQGADDTIAQYVAQLRGLATHCACGQGLDMAIRDKFVQGIRQVAIQQRLLSEDDPTLIKVVEIAQSMESARREAGYMSKTKEEVSAGPGQNDILILKNGGKRCPRCNGRHALQQCKFDASIKCYDCKGSGHTRAACKKSKHVNCVSNGYQDGDIESCLF